MISWNVNGLRAVVGKGFVDIFNSLDADIVCLQETLNMTARKTYEPEITMMGRNRNAGTGLGI